MTPILHLLDFHERTGVQLHHQIDFSIQIGDGIIVLLKHGLERTMCVYGSSFAAPSECIYILQLSLPVAQLLLIASDCFIQVFDVYFMCCNLTIYNDIATSLLRPVIWF